METNTNKAIQLKLISAWATRSKALKFKLSQISSPDLKYEPGEEGEALRLFDIKLCKRRDELINMLKAVKHPADNE